MSNLQLLFNSASAKANDVESCQVLIDEFRNESLVSQYRFLFDHYAVMALSPSNSDFEAVKSMLIEYSVSSAQDLAGAGEFGGADTDSPDVCKDDTTGIETLDVRIETQDHAALRVFQRRAKKCEFQSFEKRAALCTVGTDSDTGRSPIPTTPARCVSACKLPDERVLCSAIANAALTEFLLHPGGGDAGESCRGRLFERP